MSEQKLNRRKFLELAGSGAISLPFVTDALARTRPPDEQTLYVGTYTSGKSTGIYVYSLNMSSGELKHLDTIEGVVDPSYLTIDRRTRFLYAVNEVSQFEGKASGAVSSFAIDKNGHLKQINQKASEGGSPCYITLDRTERFVLLANYEAGNVSVLPLKRDGSLGQAVSVVQHRGSSINPDRQTGPHAHCIVLDGFNRYAFAVDLGIDKILGYRFDVRTGKLISHAAVETKPGAGPRHLTFHPNNKYAYVINELDSTMTAYSYDSRRGRLTPQQTISTLPADYSGNNTCADVHVAPSGRFLYGSNRGHDSIVVFEIDRRSGQLRHVENVSTGGKTPRNFTVDPTGRFLLAANQKSDSVVTFRIDPASGSLKPTGHSAEIPTPVCLKFVSRRA